MVFGHWVSCVSLRDVLGKLVFLRGSEPLLHVLSFSTKGRVGSLDLFIKPDTSSNTPPVGN